jgi:chromate transporter
MARSLCPDRSRAAIALAALAVVTAAPVSVGQIAAILLGAAAGLVVCRGATLKGAGPLAMPVSRRVGLACLVLFARLLVLPPLLDPAGRHTALFDAFFRAGALVFGGGHVVLPLLRDAVVGPGWVPPNIFLAGYGLVQAMPGPLFTFAAYLGAVLSPGPAGFVDAAIALLAIFLPGLLLLLGTLPFWSVLRTRPRAGAAMAGTNAAVVGLLGAAFYDPLWTSTIGRPADFVLALTGFVLLTVWRVPPLAIVLCGALGGAGLAYST